MSNLWKKVLKRKGAQGHKKLEWSLIKKIVLKMHRHKSKFENKGLRTKLKQEGFEKVG